MDIVAEKQNKKGNFKRKLICSVCNNDFFVSQYRIDNAHTKKHALTCSYKCSGLIKANEAIERFSISQDKVDLIKDLYINTNLSYHKIGERVGVSRGTVLAYRKKLSLKRERSSSLRETYRANAELKIKRSLNKYEQVHHIDLDKSNSSIENLHVFENASLHAKSHKSLEYCAIQFFKKGQIIFNETTGLYEINNK